jgi:hypothetical protein
VRLTATSIALDGGILANGRDGTGQSGGGSGGGIFLRTSRLAGGGRIEANGGKAITGSNTFGGGGGGGRIAILYENLAGFTLASVRAPGNTGSCGDTGGAGTIYVKGSGQEHGDLIVNNNGLSAPAGSTPLRAIGAGTSTALAANGLTNSATTFRVPNPVTGELGLIGVALNPNTGQGRTFRVIDNTAATLTTNPADGDLTAVAQQGDPYIGVYTFDNLKVLNGAKMTTSDRCVVIGNLESTGGSLTCNNLSR